MFVAIVTDADPTGLRDNLRFSFVVLGIQDLVLDPATLEHPRKQFALFNRRRADQDRTALDAGYW